MRDGTSGATDGRLEPGRGVKLEPVDRGDARARWILRVDAGRVDLGCRALAHVDPTVRHRLRRDGGWFRGRVVTATDRVLDVDDVFGVAEDDDTWR